MSTYENMRTADILAESLLDWGIKVVFGLPGDGINGFIEALRQRQDRIEFVLHLPIFSITIELFFSYSTLCYAHFCG
jgi:glyoxylate carboligase